MEDKDEDEEQNQQQQQQQKKTEKETDNIGNSFNKSRYCQIYFQL